MGIIIQNTGNVNNNNIFATNTDSQVVDTSPVSADQKSTPAVDSFVSTNKTTTKNAKAESFEDIMAEMNSVVPNPTTIEQKKLALTYLQRIANSDASDGTKTYWQKKADLLQAEITVLENKTKKDPNPPLTFATKLKLISMGVDISNVKTEAQGQTILNTAIIPPDSPTTKKESYKTILKEFQATFPTTPKTIEECKNALKYFERLANSDGSVALKSTWSEAAKTMQNTLKKLQGEQVTNTDPTTGKTTTTESYNVILKEFKKAFPTPPKTLADFKSALTYFTRLKASDGPDALKKTWENSAAQIEKNIKTLEDQANAGKTPGAVKSYTEILAAFKKALPKEPATEAEFNQALDFFAQLENSNASDALKAIWRTSANTLKTNLASFKKGEGNVVAIETPAKIFEDYKAVLPSPPTTAEEIKLALTFFDRLEKTSSPASVKANWRNTAYLLQQKLAKLQGNSSDK